MNNNPVKFVDPTGHMVDQGGGGGAFSMGDDWWKNRQTTTKKAQSNWNNMATKFQDTATVFSSIGGGAEIGAATAGCILGGPPGCGIGFSAGNKFHQAITNPIESTFSTLSTVSTFVSDVESGNTRFNSSGVLVLGEPSATSLSTQGLGNIVPVGVIDALIDNYASKYAHGESPGIYELTGVKGSTLEVPNRLPGLLPGILQTLLKMDLGKTPILQFGDR
jgi:hypothetical protein